MHKRKIISLFIITLLVTSCSGTWDSVKRGLTGQKANSTDEFLIKRKDPLILPPDYENLPTPDERALAKEELSIFVKSVEEVSSTENTSSSKNSTEQSILQKIRKK